MRTKHSAAKFSALTIFFVLLLSFLMLVPAFALTNEAAVETREIVSQMASYQTLSQNQRLFDATKYHIENNMDKDLKVLDTKALKDFDGNRYTLFELTPLGYIIYHNDSGRYVEYSENNLSPYNGYSGGLYYGGPKQYYRLTENYLQHTLRPDMSFEIDLVKKQALVESSRELASRLNDQPITSTLDYIQGVKNTIPSEMKSVKQGVSARSATPSISMATFFTNLLKGDLLNPSENQIGYYSIDQGACGYVAANMLLGYCYFAYDGGLIPNFNYVDYQNKTMFGNGLTKRLITLAGYDPNGNTLPGTDANDIKNVISNYFDRDAQNHRAWTLYYRLFDIDGVNTLKKGFPVILCGSLPSFDSRGNVNHVVVAYGYENYGFLNLGVRYRVHYGWAGFSDVKLDMPTIGSSFFMTF